jgi:hypothetical protein
MALFYSSIAPRFDLCLCKDVVASVKQGVVYCCIYYRPTSLVRKLKAVTSCNSNNPAVLKKKNSPNCNYPHPNIIFPA